jgi:hypothetical protein
LPAPLRSRQGAVAVLRRAITTVAVGAVVAVAPVVAAVVVPVAVVAVTRATIATRSLPGRE